MLSDIDKPVMNEETSVSEVLFCLFKVLYIYFSVIKNTKKMVTIDVLCALYSYV